MERLVVAVVLVAVAVAVALVLQRRRPAAPTQGRDWQVPSQLDRRDFGRADRPWLVAVFTSEACESCAKVVPKAQALESDEVGVEVLSYQVRRDLHDRYGIEVVPLTVVADADGIVRRSFIGDPTAIDLWGALAEVRDA